MSLPRSYTVRHRAVTMQEADHGEDWIKEMSALGYDGRFRADEYSPCLKWALGEPKLPDGVALFWKRDRLELDECVLGVNVDGDDGKVLKCKRIFARLKALDTGAFVVLATTHLKSGKSGGGRRALQSESLVADFKQFAQSEEKPASAVFITGDFNAPRGERCHDVLLSAWGSGLSDAYADAGHAGYKDASVPRQLRKSREVGGSGDDPQGINI